MTYPATIYILGEGPALHQRVAFSEIDHRQIARSGRDVTLVVCAIFALVVPSDHDQFRDVLRADPQGHVDACMMVIGSLDDGENARVTPDAQTADIDGDANKGSEEASDDTKRALLEAMSNRELRAVCEEKALAVRGSKAELVARLMAE